MPTIENHRPADFSPLRGAVARHPVLAFLLMAYAIGWSIQFAGFQLGLPLRLVFSLGAIFGLALPALLVTAATGGGEGVKDLLRRALRWRVGVRWYLVALFVLLVPMLLGASVFVGLTPLETLVEKWPLLFTVYLPEVLVAFLLIQLFEEAAWTGFAQHTLQERHGPLLASIMVAPAFALSHLMSNLLEAPQVILAFVLLAVQMVVAVFFRVVVMWLYNGAGRSVLVVALFHGAFNSATGSGDMRFVGEIFSGPVAQWMPLVVLAALAVLVLVFTRGRLAYEPDHASPQRAATAGAAVQSGAQ